MPDSEASYWENEHIYDEADFEDGYESSSQEAEFDEKFEDLEQKGALSIQLNMANMNKKFINRVKIWKNLDIYQKVVKNPFESMKPKNLDQPILDI